MWRRSIFSIPLTSLSLCLLWLGLAGCREGAKIERTRVPKTVTSAVSGNSNANDQMFVAMMRHAGKVWFFKAVGPAAQIKRLRPELQKFLQTVQFLPGHHGKPSWELPEDWVQKAGSGMRFATLEIGPAAAPLRLSVSSLSQTTDDWNQYLLSNLNRWRRQMGLGPLGNETLSDAVEVIPSGDQKIWFAVISGTAGDPLQTRSQSSSLPAGHPPISRQATRSEQLGFDPSQLTGKAPEDWQPGPITGMRKGHFSLERAAERIDITVIPAGGNMLANVNRWRGQIHLPPTTEADLEKSLQPIQADGLTGKYVKLYGPQQAILAAIFTTGKTQWFVKLKGNVELAKREEPEFEAFARSLQFKGR